MTQKDILLNFLAKTRKENYLDNQWIISYHIIKVNTPFGWLGTSSDSLARKLRQEGLVESKDQGQYVLFRITDKGLEYLYNQEKSLGFNPKVIQKEIQKKLL